jgi:RES domain-containing protein
VSCIIWTPQEVASSSRVIELTPWRAVEAQHLASTVALVDSLEEQHELETLLESSKPPMPGSFAGLHWLLFTPFRYPPPPAGSRFRAPVHPGVLYAADEVRTACAELGYWRWRFLMDSPDLASISARPQTVFRMALATCAVDLRVAPFAQHRARWTHGSEYTGCHAFAAIAREAAVDTIRYESVRDPSHGACVAVLSPAAFAKRDPIDSQPWLLSVTRSRVFWHRHSSIDSMQFEFAWGDEGDS